MNRLPLAPRTVRRLGVALAAVCVLVGALLIIPARAQEGDRVSSFSLRWASEQVQGDGVEVSEDGTRVDLTPYRNRTDTDTTGTMARAELTMHLEASEDVLEPGELCITLPRTFFVNREGERSGQGVLGCGRLVEKDSWDASEAGGSDVSRNFYYYFDDNGTPDDETDDLLVIENGVALSDALDFTCEIDYTSVGSYKAGSSSSRSCCPSDYVGNGLKGSDLTAQVSVRDTGEEGHEEHKTGPISAYFHTSAVLSSVNKVGSTKRLFLEWDSEWGEKPEDSDDYVYVVWTLGCHANNDTSYREPTQPYTLTFEDNPGNSGEIVKWVKSDEDGIYYDHVTNSEAPSGGYLSWEDAQSGPMEFEVPTAGANWMDTQTTSSFWVVVLMRYPKSILEAGSVEFTNSVTVTLTPYDNETPSKMTVEDSFSYERIDFEYPPGYYGVTKSSAREAGDGALGFLQGGSDALISYFNLGITARGGSLTYDSSLGGVDDPNAYGHKPYTVELTDDVVTLNGERLNDKDYEFARVDFYSPFSRYVEGRLDEDYIVTSSGQPGWVNRPREEWEPATLQYQMGSERAWVDYAQMQWTPYTGFYLLGEDGKPSESVGDRVQLPSGVTGIRLVYETTAGRTYISYLRAAIRIKPTDHVKELISQSDSSAQLYNVNSLIVYDSEGVPQNMGASLDTSFSSSENLTQIVKSRDEELYGTLYQGAPYPMHDAASVTLTPFTVETETTKTHDGKDDAANGRVSVTYDVCAVEKSEDADVEESEPLFASGALQEQRSGTFYDLLPPGFVVDEATIRVRVGRYESEGVACPFDVSYEENWRGSGRTMMVVRVQLPDSFEERNAFKSTFGAVRTGVESGFHLSFTGYYDYESYDIYGPTLLNSIAYVADEGELADGYADTGGELQDAELFADLNGDGNPEGTLKNVSYAEDTFTMNYPISTELTNRKLVRAADDVSWSRETSVNEAGSYSYALQNSTEQGGTESNIIFYDELEEYDDGGAAERWYGTLEGVDVSQLERRGIDAKLYYTTHPASELDLLGDSDESARQRDLHATGSIWSSWDENPLADLSQVTAIAVDATTKTDGTPYVLEQNQSLIVVVNMRAPEKGGYELQLKDAVALNQMGVSCVRTSATGVEEPTLITTLNTTVHIKGALPTSLTFTKVDGSSDAHAPLPGASFNLYQWVGEGDPDESALVDVESPGDSWRLCNEPPVVSREDGTVSFDGLFSGRYRLVELEAAGGFFTPTGQWSFSVDTEAEEGEKISDFSYVAGPDGEVPPAFAADEEAGLTLPNYRPFDLPSSGGAGTAALVCGGAAAVAAGAVWIARRRR